MQDLSKYYTLLRDPTRRKIIEILGTQEKIGFKELRQILGVGVGTVYYHLDMLSDFLVQDKQRKYRLNERGQMLYKSLKEGAVPAALELSETFSHRLGRWVFLSPVFAKTVKPARALPIAIFVLFLGAVGAAFAGLDSALFFYFPYSVYDFSEIVLLYVFNWIGLFLFVELLSYLLYKRVGNELQLFACMGLASLPFAIFPYLYMALPSLLPIFRLADLDMVRQYALIILQAWGLLLTSAAVCFGKGLRLDKAIVITLTAVYFNIAALFLLGRFV